MLLDKFSSLEQVIERQPLTVTSQTPVTEVICLMGKQTNTLRNNGNSSDSIRVAQTKNSCVLITQNSQLQGIFTEKDLIKLIPFKKDLASISVAEVMNREVICLQLTGSENILTAINLLNKYNLSYLPVIDQNCQLVGLINQKTLFQVIQLIYKQRHILRLKL